MIGTDHVSPHWRVRETILGGLAEITIGSFFPEHAARWFLETYPSHVQGVYKLQQLTETGWTDVQ